MTLNRIVPLSGLVFVALTIIAFGPLGGSTPGAGASQAKIVDFYSRHHGAETAAVYVMMIGAAFLVLFAASMWSRIGAESQSSLWRIVFVAGAAIAAAGFLAAVTLHFALSEGVNAGASPAAAQALNTLDAKDYLAFSAGIGIMLVGAAGMMIPLRGLSRALGFAAVVLGVAIFTPAGFIAFMLSGVWIVVASIALTASEPGEETALAPAPA